MTKLVTDILRRGAGVVFHHQQLVSLAGKSLHFERLPEAQPDADGTLRIGFLRPHEIARVDLSRISWGGSVRRLRQGNAELVGALDFDPARIHRSAQRFAVAVESGVVIDA